MTSKIHFSGIGHSKSLDIANKNRNLVYGIFGYHCVGQISRLDRIDLPHGVIDEPGIVTINGEEAKMRNQTEFETWLNLSPGTHQIDIEATDYNENTASQSYEVTIASTPEEHFEYDLNGNLVERTGPNGTTTYHWDAFDRLIAIHYPDGTSSHFTYDGMSRRVQIVEKDDQENITHERKFLWIDLVIAEERSGTNGGTVEKRFFDNGVEIITGSNAGSYTYRTDHLGSIREVVGASGILAARFDYDTWGELKQEPIAFDTEDGPIYGMFDLDFRYTGHFYHSESGLYLTLFRAYDSELGRWLSRDPLGEDGGLNLYGYVINDPINGWDPYGLKFLSWTGTAGQWAENAAQFSMGLSDYLTFDLNKLARERLYGNDYSDPCSAAYKTGTYTGMGIDLGTGGASAGLKFALRKKGKEVARKEANAAIRRLPNTQHHVNTVIGHPTSVPGVTSHFPLGGLPASIHSGRWNLRQVAPNPRRGILSGQHMNLHKRARMAENAALGSAALGPGRTIKQATNGNCD